MIIFFLRRNVNGVGKLEKSRTRPEKANNRQSTTDPPSTERQQLNSLVSLAVYHSYSETQMYNANFSRSLTSIQNPKSLLRGGNHRIAIKL